MSEDKHDNAESLWGWVTRYPDGTVGLVGMVTQHLGGGVTHAPLVCRSRAAAETVFAPIARQHRELTGQEVWLRQFHSFTDHQRLE